MVAPVRIGAWLVVLACASACSRINPAYGLDEGAGEGSSDADDGSAVTSGDDAKTTEGTDTVDGGAAADTTSTGDPLDAGGDDLDSSGPPDSDTSASADDGSGEASESTGEPLAEPEVVIVFAGPVFTGRIEHGGKLGYDGATEACIDTAASIGVSCEEKIVAVLGVGTPEERAVDFATFLGVVGSTPVQGFSTTVLTTNADQFFTGPLDASLWQADVFPSQTHLWSGFDPAQASDNCEDWTNDDSAVDGGVGDSAYVLSWSATGNFGCHLSEPILCACW